MMGDMIAHILIIHHSLHGHTHFLAESIEKGALEVKGAQVEMRRVPVTKPPEVLERLGAADFYRSFLTIPVCTMDDLARADAIFLGAPVYLGGMCGEMRDFLDSLRGQLDEGLLQGKIGGVFSCSSQAGGQEGALLSMHASMLELGMMVAGMPISFEGKLVPYAAPSPYGTNASPGGPEKRWPSAEALEAARVQGKYVATMAARMSRPGEG